MIPGPSPRNAERAKLFSCVPGFVRRNLLNANKSANYQESSVDTPLPDSVRPQTLEMADQGTANPINPDASMIEKGRKLLTEEDMEEYQKLMSKLEYWRCIYDDFVCSLEVL